MVVPCFGHAAAFGSAGEGFCVECGVEVPEGEVLAALAGF